ncbi:hypothetical protein NADE_006838 [Nannochloris sp. 'desiccata']|nr:hypothetical protein KSW81_005224 [Chlorella desiccata (nom. nud.)]KAH7621577.1 hypothetical protein NADE_006838 [Chlorella desiccata (nom. nud.)]
MDRFPSTEPQKRASSPPGGSLQKAATTSLAAAWLIYRSLLSGPVSQVVPGPTREAVFQLFCDIRANVPKDKRFLQRHAKAFTPQTHLGWLALSGVLGYVVSAALLVTTLSLGISVAGLSIGLMVVLATGAFLASALGFMAFVLFTSAFVVGAVALTALSGYVVGSSSLAVMRHITQLVFGGNGSINSSLSSSEGMQQQTKNKSSTTTGPTTISVATDTPVNTREAEKPTTPTTTRLSTYAVPHAVLPPIKTASPTKKRSHTTPATSVPSPPSAATAHQSTTNSQKEEVIAQLKESPSSSMSTSTAAECNVPPLTAVAVEPVVAVAEQEIAISLEKEKEKLVDALQNEEGESPAPVFIAAAPTRMKYVNKPTVIAIETTNSTKPFGARTITMMKPDKNERIKTSSPAPLPRPPVSSLGLLKPISPPSSSVTSPAAQDTSLSSSSLLSPIVNVVSKNNSIDYNGSSGAFTVVMQGWKELEKKAEMELSSGAAAKLPLPRKKRKSKNNKGKSSSGKSSSRPLEGEVMASTLDPKTPET